MSLSKSLAERLQASISDPNEFARQITKAILQLAELVDSNDEFARSELCKQLNEEEES
jgi:hypothetical protein